MASDVTKRVTGPGMIGMLWRSDCPVTGLGLWAELSVCGDRGFYNYWRLELIVEIALDLFNQHIFTSFP